MAKAACGIGCDLCAFPNGKDAQVTKGILNLWSLKYTGLDLKSEAMGREACPPGKPALTGGVGPPGSARSAVRGRRSGGLRGVISLVI